LIEMKKQMHRLGRSEKGTALVEFALLAPVILLLLVGLIEVGRYTYFAVLAANAARAGALYGAENGRTALDSSGMRTAALADAQNIANMTVPTARYFCLLDGTSTLCPSTGARQSNWVYYVEVDTSGTYNSLFRYPGIPQSVTVSGKAITRVVSQ
jgi:Flp pilus assembly protein TadG